MGAKLKSFLRELPSRISACDGRRMIVVGDIGLDEYVMGDVRRISPEAPVPVLEVQSQDARLGLAANVAQNVASLGGQALLVGVVGADGAADDLRSKLRAVQVPPEHLITDGSRPTTRKLRVMSGSYHIVRVDFEKKQYLSNEAEKSLTEKVSQLLKTADGLVIEDYAKGALSETSLQAMIKVARDLGKPVFVDPNRTTPARFYNGCSVVTPNRDEAVAMSGLDYDDLRMHPGFILEVGQALLSKMQAENIVITRGSEGMTIVDKQGATHLPTFAKQVFDVTGAGDTVIAALALAHLSGFSLSEACVIGNLAAGVVVGKVGCVPCTREELLAYAATLADEI